jgi:hypothetical protein
LISFLAITAAVVAIHHWRADPDPTENFATPDPFVTQTLNEAIIGASAYLIRACEPTGRFLYKNLDGVQLESRYNVLRHAGAIYALSAFYRFTSNKEAKHALLRATRYLLDRHLKPLEARPDVIAVWSLPGEESQVGRPIAKLGGTALGLIALVEARGIDPEMIALDTLEGLGRFILFMQRPSGGFYSKYDELNGLDKEFVSLYYPGEAILALTMLFEETNDIRWLRAAERGASFLVQSRQHMPTEKLPADHWLMIASAKLQKHLAPVIGTRVARDALLEHNRDLARMMLAEQAGVTEEWASGSFVADGRSTPSATRLEGLLALYSWLDDEDPLRQEIAAAARDGVAFLLRCQIMDGPSEGGVIRALRTLDTEDASFNRRQSEIRIDYVQHSLSAWLQYRANGLDVLTRYSPDSKTRPPATKLSSPIREAPIRETVQRLTQ